MNKNFDVVIVGASVAGSSLAIRLGKLGISTAIIEKSEFPRRKACGEGLSHQGVELLEELGLGESLEGLCGAKFHGYKIWQGDFATEIKFDSNSNETNYGLGIQRYKLDNLLLTSALSHPSVTGFISDSVKEIEQRGEEIIIQTNQHKITTRFLVLADGANSKFAQKLNLSSAKPRRNRYGYSLILKGKFLKKPSAVNIITFPEMQICCTPIGEDTLNISVLVNKNNHSLLQGKSAVNKIIKMVESKIGFEGTITDYLNGSALNGGHNKASNNKNILLIGDCLEQLDPIGGMGMTNALISANCASKALEKIIIKQTPAKLALIEYKRNRELAVRPLRGFTRLSYFTIVKLRGTKLSRALQVSRFATKLSSAVHQLEEHRNLQNLLTRTMLAIFGINL